MAVTRKVKTLEEVAKLIGPRPRRRKVAMAHGCFDIVHPGHIRHLSYAKGKAAILVASVTSDSHVDKGRYRPHIPEDLRAMNLAALECVDYVLVDDEATPLKSIAVLEPDYFAKGYEYVSAGSAETAAEAAAVGAYGGKMLFTPGDVVYSSTRLLEQPPAIGREKLLAAMERDGLTFDGLKARLKFEGLRVHVIGDLIIDALTETTSLGANAKTPTLSVLKDGTQLFVGGAGVVAKHMQAAGADVTLSTLVGEDPEGAWAQEHCPGITLRGMTEAGRPTTLKEAIVCGGQRLLKIDRLDNRPISDDLVENLCKALHSVPADAVVFADFRHGIFTRKTIPILADAIRAPFRAADSQVASRWGNVLDFKDFDLLTPNEREARFALGDQDSIIRPLVTMLSDASRAKNVLMKLGARGVMGASGRQFVSLDSFARHVEDPVGAGDALLAYSVLTMAAGGGLAEAAILGSVAAGLECEVQGNLEVTRDAVLGRLAEIEAESNYVFFRATPGEKVTIG